MQRMRACLPMPLPCRKLPLACTACSAHGRAPPNLPCGHRGTVTGAGAFGSVWRVMLGGHTECAAKIVEWSGRGHNQLEFIQASAPKAGWAAVGWMRRRKGACLGAPPLQAPTGQVAHCLPPSLPAPCACYLPASTLASPPPPPAQLPAGGGHAAAPAPSSHCQLPSDKPHRCLQMRGSMLLICFNDAAAVPALGLPVYPTHSTPSLRRPHTLPCHPLPRLRCSHPCREERHLLMAFCPKASEACKRGLQQLGHAASPPRAGAAGVWGCQRCHVSAQRMAPPNLS